MKCECGVCDRYASEDRMKTCDICNGKQIDDADHFNERSQRLWSVCKGCEETGAYQEFLEEQIWNRDEVVKRLQDIIMQNTQTAELYND